MHKTCCVYSELGNDLLIRQRQQLAGKTRFWTSHWTINSVCLRQFSLALAGWFADPFSRLKSSDFQMNFVTETVAWLYFSTTTILPHNLETSSDVAQGQQRGPANVEGPSKIGSGKVCYLCRTLLCFIHQYNAKKWPKSFCPRNLRPRNRGPARRCYSSAVRTALPTPHREGPNALMAVVCPSVCTVPDPKSRTEGHYAESWHEVSPSNTCRGGKFWHRNVFYTDVNIHSRWLPYNNDQL